MSDTQTIQKPLLTAAELATLTGLTPAQVWRWAAEGRFPGTA